MADETVPAPAEEPAKKRTRKPLTIEDLEAKATAALKVANDLRSRAVVAKLEKSISPHWLDEAVNRAGAGVTKVDVLTAIAKKNGLRVEIIELPPPPPKKKYPKKNAAVKAVAEKPA